MSGDDSGVHSSCRSTVHQVQPGHPLGSSFPRTVSTFPVSADGQCETATLSTICRLRQGSDVKRLLSSTRWRLVWSISILGTLFMETSK
jgi:hypothetical protein